MASRIGQAKLAIVADALGAMHVARRPEHGQPANGTVRIMARIDLVRRIRCGGRSDCAVAAGARRCRGGDIAEQVDVELAFAEHDRADVHRD